MTQPQQAAAASMGERVGSGGVWVSTPGLDECLRALHDDHLAGIDVGAGGVEVWLLLSSASHLR